MKLLHTADWHIGSNWKGIDRADDLLNRAVPDLVGIALEEKVELVLIAGDVFEKQTTESLEQAARTLNQPFRELLEAHIDIALLVGNHDSAPLFRVLRSAIGLVGNESTQRGQLYILNAPQYFASIRGIQVVSLPYMRPEELLKWLRESLPTDEPSAELVNWELGRKLDRAALLARDRLDHTRPAILTYHGVVQGAKIGDELEEWEMSYNQGFMLNPLSLLMNDQVPQYNALGHIHKAQEIPNAVPTRYCGSLDRLNQGEKSYTPSCLLVEFPAKGRQVEIEVRHLPRPTPFLEETIHTAKDLRRLSDKLGESECKLALGRILLDCEPADTFELDQLTRDTFPRLKQVKEAVLRQRQELSARQSTTTISPLLQELANPHKTINTFIQQNIAAHQQAALLRALELVEKELGNAN